MNEDQQKVSSIDLESLKALSVLGRGAKGVVFLVQNKLDSLFTDENLALKVISKSFIENKNKKNNGDYSVDEYRRIWFERDVLKLFNHPLLPKLKGVIVNDEIVGFAINYCAGGNLNSLRKRQTERMFSDDIIRFYAAELVLALEYLHDLGIIYRDLKPENVMIQENGHLMLVDFDLSTKISSKSEKTLSQSESESESRSSINESISMKKTNKKKKKKKRFLNFFICNSGIAPVESVKSGSQSRVDSLRSDSEKSNSFVGTEDYVSPEIISGNGHDFSVDWWGLGVVLYEMLYGITPFRGINRKETFYRILTKTPELVGEKTALRDLIGKLLEKDPTKRISLEGIKNHEFFKGLDWDTILSISRTPYIPIPERSEGEYEGEEDTDGINEIDIKKFVNVVFNGEDLKKDEKEGRDQWVEGLSNPTTHNISSKKKTTHNKRDEFLVF